MISWFTRVLIFVFTTLYGCKPVNAQLGISLEEGSKLPGQVSSKNYKKYGEEFAQIVTEDSKGLVLEMDFFKNRCESARWILRKGELPGDFSKELWKTNFENDSYVNEGNDTWRGSRGGLLSHSITKDGNEVIWVRSAKMDKIIESEAVRRVEKKMGMKIDEETLKKIKAVKITDEAGPKPSQPQQKQIYNEKGDWVGVLRNGKLYGTDGEWKGTVRNGQIYNTESTWSGTINNSGQIYNTEYDLKGNVHNWQDRNR